MDATTRPLSGRRAQAARNDQRILEAARHVFVADPAAPIGAVANQAGVGMSALYRRYHSKEELLARLAGDGLRRYITEAEAALADHEARRRLGGRYRYDSSHRRRNPWLPTRRCRRPDSLATQCRHAYCRAYRSNSGRVV